MRLAIRKAQEGMSRGQSPFGSAIVRAGEVIVIPSHLPHRALALEDTLDVDVFCPPRQDWLAGTDAYLRG